MKINLIVQKQGAVVGCNGVIALLEGVERYGSIFEAARRMKMAYSKAHRILNEAESVSGKKLLERNGSYGSTLSDYGKEVIRAYHEAEEAALAILEPIL